MTQSEAAGEIQAYADSDGDTRRLVENQLDRVHWQTRQQYFLQWAGLIFGFLITWLSWPVPRTSSRAGTTSPERSWVRWTWSHWSPSSSSAGRLRLVRQAGSDDPGLRSTG
ncbi:hypothetical protein V5P93_007332 [Actinokineospora auranticolor]|uniref:hypothetical protein n=1 Tax=Actinokineospora auranticolor TaxID=155976 RepID=UPI0011B05CBB|nr:hypothetical protein [Actinokineospora auranticolor]